jgi:hypothetical protein
MAQAWGLRSQTLQNTHETHTMSQVFPKSVLPADPDLQEPQNELVKNRTIQNDRSLDSFSYSPSPKVASDVMFVLQVRKEHLWIGVLGLLVLVLWMRLSVVSSKLALLETTLALGSK